MKTEIILARVNEVLALNDDFVTVRCKLESLSADLAEQVRTEYAASRGEANAAKTISALLKAVRKDCGKTALHYAWIDGKGRQCVCDGYRAFRLNEALPLEERPADAGDPINLDKVVPDIRKGYAAAALPGAKEVKAFIALERAAKGRKVSPVWDFGKDKPAVNAAYLVDLLNAATPFCSRFVPRPRTPSMRNTPKRSGHASRPPRTPPTGPSSTPTCWATCSKSITSVCRTILNTPSPRMISPTWFSTSRPPRKRRRAVPHNDDKTFHSPPRRVAL